MLICNIYQKTRKAGHILFALLLTLNLFLVSSHAQSTLTAAFPYDIEITTVAGNCYDDCRIIIDLKDNAGNVVQINPQTHNAQDPITYPIYNVQYHYRNLSAGMNTQHDTVNNIQVSTGNYCIGITAYVPDPSNTGEFLLVDTSICNIEVTAHYEHLEASVLSTWARNNYEVWDEGEHEFCGFRASFTCEDRGRIQLLITKGKFPYHVTILDDMMDTVRQRTFWQRTQSGWADIYADYMDYYTFDSMPPGNYRILVSDSCDYSIVLTFLIPDLNPTNYNLYAHTYTNCGDSNILHFHLYRETNNLHDYDIPYLDSIIRYRFINSGSDTTAWYYPKTSPWDLYSIYFDDTIARYNNYCPIYHDTIVLEFEDLCTNLSRINRICYIPAFDFSYEVQWTILDISTTPDTCMIVADSGLVTQTYTYSLYPSWWYNSTEELDSQSSINQIYSHLYSCPISYDVWSATDSSLIAHESSDDYSWFCAPVTFTEDTIIPVHITVTDAHGCLLNELDEVFEYIIETPGNTYYYHNRGIGVQNWCTNDGRDLEIWEEGVNALLFRQNMSIHLFESPLYNYYNFTAICQNGEWSYTLEDSTNHSSYMSFSMGESGWYAYLRDSLILTLGRYSFEVITSCGIDTFEYTMWTGFDHDSLVFIGPTQFDMHQICDRLIVQPLSVPYTVYEYYIDPGTDNNELLLNTYTPYYDRYVYSGVPGGYNEWPDPDESFTFTLPGTYIIMTRSYSGWWCSYAEYLDTINFIPEYIDFDLGYAIICDYVSNTGAVLTNAIRGLEPYTYYLYDQADLTGNLIGSNTTGYFNNVSMTVGQQFSVLAIDSCQNSYYVNLTAASLSQSVLAWETGEDAGNGHCEGDTVHLSALPFTFQADYQWTGPNGFTSNTRMNDFAIPYNGVSGWYILEILNTGCATTVTDSVFIQVIQAPRVTIISDSPVCPGADATIGFAVQGNSPVDFTIYHTGAPTSGTESFTVNANDTLFLQYPILSDNIFWADQISDNACAYQYIIDSTLIAVQHVFDVNPPMLNTNDGYACYNHAATLSITAPLTTPYYVFWYDNPQQEHLLKCDTITQANTPSFCQIEHLTSDSSLYVSVANENYCARLYGNFYYVVNMHNGNTILNAGECARLFDSGGESHHYGNNEHFTYTFNGNGIGTFKMVINQSDIAIGDTLYIFSGNSPNPDSLLICISNNAHPNNFTIHSSSITFVFNSNWTNNREGWSIDILTEVPMTEVYGYISPTTFDTIIDVLCPSTMPYQIAGVPDIDISQPMDYILDTLLIVDGTCQNQLHLHLTVNATSATSVHDSLMPCQLPVVWNGISFTDYGTQTAVLTNAVGCDSSVTMTIYWAPPVDSTTVFDTIVENQLPYLINGLTFNGPGTQIATLSNSNGCDSIVTVHLHVYYNVTAEVDAIICDNELPLVWNGVAFTQSDTQTVVLTNIHGADSTLTMRVTVHPTSHTTLKDTICQRVPYNNYGFILSESETATSGMNTFTRVLNNVFDCDSVVELQMLITPDITPNFYADPDKTMLSENPDIQFINTTDISEIENMSYYWIWDFGDETGDTTTAYNNEHTYTQWGDYTVTLTLVVNDCESYFSSEVIIEADLKFPNVITPNGDGVNDVFIIKDLNPERNNQLHIVDRWGKTVFDQKNYQTYMKDDIVYNAESGFGMGNLSEGVYFYTFYYEGKVRTIQFNGTVTIIR